MIGNFAVERERVGGVNSTISAEIVRLQATIAANEAALNSRWNLVTEFKKITKVVTDELEEIWYDAWIELDDGTRAVHGSYDDYGGSRAEEVVKDRHREFMSRPSTVVAIEAYIAHLSDVSRTATAEAIEKAITNRDLTFLRRTVLGEERPIVGQGVENGNTQAAQGVVVPGVGVVAAQPGINAPIAVNAGRVEAGAPGGAN